MKRLLLIPVFALLVASAQAWPQPGEPAPDFTVQDTTWENHTLSELHGKVILLNFWAST